MIENSLQVNHHELTFKEYEGQRVVTFKDIDTVHERPEGTAKRNFNKNKKHFIKGIDYFFVSPQDVRTYEIRTSEINNSGTYLIGEQGYLMIVKSFRDDLAWDVQRTLVNSYFKFKEVSTSIQEQQLTFPGEYVKGCLDKFIEIEERHLVQNIYLREIVQKSIKSLDVDMKEIKGYLESMGFALRRAAPQPNYTNWKKPINEKVNKIAEYSNTSGLKVLSSIYRELKSNYGHDINKIRDDLKAQGNEKPLYTALDVIEQVEGVREDFEYVLNARMAEWEQELQSQENEEPEEAKADIKEDTIGESKKEAVEESKEEPKQEVPQPKPLNKIQAVINPLAELLKDPTLNYNLTYRKVYAAMGVDWNWRKTRYKNQHGLVGTPNNTKLLDENEKLFNLFKVTVNKMMEEAKR